MSQAMDPEKAAATASTHSRSSEEKGRMYASDHVQEKEAYNAHIDVSGIDERKLLRKLDWYLVHWLSFLYLLSFLDRTSIGKCVCESARC